MEPVQGLNLNRRYISGLEPELPVTLRSANHYLYSVSVLIPGYTSVTWHLNKYLRNIYRMFKEY